jgi:transketolase
LARAGDFTGRPTVIIAHTVKGKGLSLAEGVHTWHSIVPSAEDFERARQELEPDEIDLLDSHVHRIQKGASA